MRRLSSQDGVEVNPYIALADNGLSMVMVMTLFTVMVLLAILQKEDTRKDVREEFYDRVIQAFPEQQRPQMLDYKVKNDPPGAQRWVFKGQVLFVKGTAKLTPQGKQLLSKFADLMAQNTDKWRRARIEGHTMPTPLNKPDNWDLANLRASTVAKLFTDKSCAIRANSISTSGRGGQSKALGLSRSDQRNERVEIILEYSALSASEKTDDTGGCNP